MNITEYFAEFHLTFPLVNVDEIELVVVIQLRIEFLTIKAVYQHSVMSDHVLPSELYSWFTDITFI